MKTIEDWYRKQATSWAKRPQLEEAFVSGRFARYGIFRLRFFAANIGLRVFSNVIELLLIGKVFGVTALGPYLLFKILISAIGAFWWGGLEWMRGDVRNIYRRGQGYRIPRVLYSWIMAARWVAWTLALSGALAIFLVFLVSEQPMFFAILLCILWVGGAVNLYIRTLHSGVYAIRRVYRPLWAIALGQFLLPIVFFCFLPFGQALALNLAMTVAISVGAALSFRFISAAYCHFGFSFPPGILPNRLRFPWSRFVNRRFLDPALAWTLNQTESWVIFFGLWIGLSVKNPELLSILFVIAPLLEASRQWAFLFYFDLKKLEPTYLSGLRQHFERKTEVFGRYVAFVAWLIALGVGWILFRWEGVWLICSLVALFIVQGFAAYRQIEAFARARYSDLSLAGLRMIAGVAVVWFFGTADPVWLILLPIGLLWGVGRLNSELSSGVDPSSGQFGALPFPLFVRHARRMNTPHRLQTFSCSKEIKLNELKRVQSRIGKCIHEKGGVSSLLPNRILVAILPGGDLLDERKVLQAGRGWVSGIWYGDEYPCAEKALHAAADSGRLGRFCAGRSSVRVYTSVEQVDQAFNEFFQSGIIIDSFGEDPLSQIPAKHRREVFRRALVFSKWGPTERKANGLFVATLVDPDGVWRRIYFSNRSQKHQIQAFEKILMWEQVKWGGEVSSS